MVSTSDFNISFDTDSCTSVDKHTFTKYLTSDSLNETSPSSETYCAVEGSRIDSCDYSYITCQRVSDTCNCSNNNGKSVTMESLTFDKTVDVVESSDISINSSVLPESLTSVYINNCSHDVQIPCTNSLEHVSSTENADSWLLYKELHIVHLSIHYVLQR